MGIFLRCTIRTSFALEYCIKLWPGTRPLLRIQELKKTGGKQIFDMCCNKFCFLTQKFSQNIFVFIKRLFQLQRTYLQYIFTQKICSYMICVHQAHNPKNPIFLNFLSFLTFFFYVFKMLTESTKTSNSVHIS